MGKKTNRQKLAHSTKRKDWEKVLDELFLQVIHASSNGLAVISNTARNGEQDIRGHVSSKLTFRIGNSVPNDLKDAIRQLNLQGMANMYAKRPKVAPNETDCYKLKNLGLPNNVLTYFIEQPDNKKALVVFSSPIMQKELAKLVKAIDQTLRGEEKQAHKVEHKAPQSFSKFQFQKTSIDLLKKRLNYLEDLDTLSSKEQQELEDLEDYVMRSLKHGF